MQIVQQIYKKKRREKKSSQTKNNVNSIEWEFQLCFAFTFRSICSLFMCYLWTFYYKWKRSLSKKRISRMNQWINCSNEVINYYFKYIDDIAHFSTIKSKRNFNHRMVHVVLLVRKGHILIFIQLFKWHNTLITFAKKNSSGSFHVDVFKRCVLCVRSSLRVSECVCQGAEIQLRYTAIPYWTKYSELAIKEFFLMRICVKLILSRVQLIFISRRSTTTTKKKEQLYYLSFVLSIEKTNVICQQCFEWNVDCFRIACEWMVNDCANYLNLGPSH